MKKQLYCQSCGSILQKKLIEARERNECPICGWVYYPQLKVTAGVLVEKEGKILLVQRNIDPWKSCWYLPAGYVEDDEPPRIAAEREALEETGFEIETGAIKDVLFYNDDPRGNGILILYQGKIISGAITKNKEAMDIRFFSIAEIDNIKLAGGSHDISIRNWSREYPTG